MIGEEMTFEELKEQAKNLPLTPGVYLMKDREGYVIYVGKSKHLKNRVSSYFGSLKHVKPRIKRMVAAIDTFECKSGLYFGPYDQSADLLTAVEALRNYFGLPSCKQGEGVEGCLTYKLKRCDESASSFL